MSSHKAINKLVVVVVVLKNSMSTHIHSYEYLMLLTTQSFYSNSSIFSSMTNF
jgi:hypothetical protein